MGSDSLTDGCYGINAFSLATGSMQIVCPHCTTSYAVDPATFGTTGRTVRCARCKDTWVAYPEEVPPVQALATADGAGDDWDVAPEASADHAESHHDMPVVDSPSISSAMPDGADAMTEDAEWTALARQDELTEETPRSRRGRFGLPALSLGPLARYRVPFGLPIACAAMGALVLCLVVWRADVVRLMPQTAAFFNAIGLGVNLRGLAFEDVRISTELVDNKPVLIIEGNIIDVAKKPMEIPRLRFLVRDAGGNEIYAWNAVLEQPVLKPGDKAWFKSRLASPPPEGREIAVRFFSRRDLATGGS
jgi:predicted Zn finger-like uncharacterized protein